MATYFHGSHEIPPEIMQTLYLMNPNFAGYSDAPPPVNMIFLNSATNSLNLLTLPQPQHLVGIPVQDSTMPSSSVHWTPTQQGLSLSLPVPEITSHAMVRDEEVKVLGSQSTALVNSKYLRSAQQLLDEVVGVWKGIRDGSVKDVDPKKSNGEGDHVDESAKQRVELTTVERQELQMKKAKLVNMLDEIGRRYRQYHHKMQIIVSSFEAAAGVGSAKAYTALAVQTISKQFRCLRDAITSQIRATAKSLGEEEFTDEEGTKSKLYRVQSVDQQVRQQRALQQLGMIHQNAWRPQRGLPERSVSVLRAWLFEHFLHPYPKDSDKQMLAKQTGLTKSQVSNWFINARVRLWKPMVEEMYEEEMKGQEQSNAEEKTSETNVKEDSSSKSHNSPSVSVPPFFTNVYSHSSYGEGDDDLFMQSNLKKACSEESMNRAIYEHNYSFITGSTSHGGGFGEYSVGKIERFGIEQVTPRLSSNGVSLTLGLTQYGNLSLSETQPSYISSNGIENNGFRGLDNNQSSAHPSNAYENMSIESRKRFASQLLPDFVAKNL